MEVIPFVSFQSMGFRIGNSKIKVNGHLKSHNLHNPTKRWGINLKLHRRMGNDIINIIKRNPHENKAIKVFKNNQSTKGWKDP